MMISYAQNFEDVMLNRLFGGSTDGFYIDVGAADPINLSVTKWFYDTGWSGINVEPHPFFHGKLSQERPRDINLNCGAGPATGSARFYEHETMEWSTCDAALAGSEGARGGSAGERIVPIRTLNDIIEANAPDREIAFLKIDVEGWEEQVLRGIDLRRHRPTVILLEAIDRDSRLPVTNQAGAILHRADYLHVYHDGINDFYLKREQSHLRAKFAKPPDTFDDFILHREAELMKQVEMLTTEFRALSLRLQESEAGRLAQVRALASQLKRTQAVIPQLEAIRSLYENSQAIGHFVRRAYRFATGR